MTDIILNLKRIKHRVFDFIKNLKALYGYKVKNFCLNILIKLRLKKFKGNNDFYLDNHWSDYE